MHVETRDAAYFVLESWQVFFTLKRAGQGGGVMYVAEYLGGSLLFFFLFSEYNYMHRTVDERG